MLDKRELAIELAMRWLGKPYLWGGDDPLAGFDCSGLVVEVLKSVGLLPRDGDWTAESLRQRFPGTSIPDRGCLVFWGTDTAIHVELLLDPELAIGASGGGSKTLTLEDAIRQNAYIKVRPWASRPGMLGFADPFSLPH